MNRAFRKGCRTLSALETVLFLERGIEPALAAPSQLQEERTPVRSQSERKPARTMRYVLFILFLLFLPSAVQSQVTDADSALDKGIHALKRGAPGEAQNWFERATDSQDSAAEAHYWLAKLYLDSPFRNPGEAWRQLQEARTLDPDDPAFILERIRQLRSDFGFFGSESIREGERKRLGRLLTQSGADSLAATGYEEIGESEARRFERFRSEFIQTLRRRADEAFDAATTALENALELNPDRLRTWTELLKLYLRGGRLSKADGLTSDMQFRFPETPDAWFLRGLVLMMEGDYETSMERSQQGLDLLDPDSVTAYEALSYLGAGSSVGYWFDKDSRRLTVFNERQASHYARLAYADLIYPRWRENPHTSGYITPGEVILRYGIPLSEFHIRPSFAGSRPIPAKMILSYQGLSFTFEDEFASNEWLIPSSMGEHDPVTDARSTFRETPQRSDPPAKDAVNMPYLISRFRGPDGLTDVVVGFGLGVNAVETRFDLDIALKTGAYLISGAGRNVSAIVRDHDFLDHEQLRTFGDQHAWADAVVLSARPGDYTVQIEGESDELVSVNSSPITLRRWTNDLSLSDPLLASGIEEAFDAEMAPGEIARNGFRIRPAAMRTVSHDAPIYVYYEVYGLTPDAGGASTYQTDVVLQPVDETQGVFSRLRDLFAGNDPLPVAASFTSQVSADEDASYQILDLSAYEPGTYRIILRVRDENSNGESFSEQRIILQ